MKARADYYVYGLFRPDTGIVFYIGMGTGSRALQHERGRKRGRSLKDNVICKYIDAHGHMEIPVGIFQNGLTRESAIALEIALIYAIGRKPLGPLVNISRGGKGVDSETARKIQTERYKDPAERERTRVAVKKARGTSKSRAKTSAQMMAQLADPESAWNKSFRDPMVVKRRVDGIRASRKRPGVLANMSAAMRREWRTNPRVWWTDGVSKQRRLLVGEQPPFGWRLGRLSATQECCEAISKGNKRRYADPAERLKTSESAYRGWITRRLNSSGVRARGVP